MYSTTTKELTISLFMCFRIFNFGQIKMIFRRDENLKKKFFIANVNVYRYSYLIKTDKYFKTNCCLVIKGRSHPIGNLHRVLPTHGFL